MFYLSRVIKPSMIAMRGAWISGGIEWNAGPQGHTVSCVSPVDALVGQNPDGPYIEVQSGPLPTQSDYGALWPRDEVAWREWWYPVHGLGDGFEFATRDVAVQTVREDDQLQLRILSASVVSGVTCAVSNEQGQPWFSRSFALPRNASHGSAGASPSRGTPDGFRNRSSRASRIRRAARIDRPGRRRRRRPDHRLRTARRRSYHSCPAAARGRPGRCPHRCLGPRSTRDPRS